MRIGIDTGGTFTDFVFLGPQGGWIHKVPSTPQDPLAAILSGLRELCPQGLTGLEVVHGTTVGTNAFLTRTGARVALITTRGFEDVLFIGRQTRPHLFHLSPSRPANLLNRDQVIGAAERLKADGSIRLPLTSAEIAKVREAVRELAPEAVAICLLHAYAHPAHEERLGQGLSPLGVPISLSSRVLPEIREYERTCATVLNAYLGPVLERYLGAWSRALPETPLYIQQSNGGFLPARQAGSWGLTTILSGPAGGVAGAFKVGQGEGANHLLTLDMGGTSTDVALLAGEIPYTGDYCLDGFPLGLPVMDIHTVGAGGGSIAYRDQGGALRVGPASAGADPGPVCYGQGGQVTVTDAQLFLGRLLPESFLGGRMPLALSATRQAVKRLSQEFGVGPVELCLAILRTANATMAKALAAVSLEKGYDPRQFTLLGFGGAGGLHVCELARELGIRRIIIPAHAGVLSALGMALAGLRRDFSRTLLMPDKELSFASLEKAYGELSNEALEEMKADCEDLRSLAAAATVELRYRGQSHTLPVPLTPAWREEFHRRHQRLYGHCFFDRELEAVLLRLSLMAPEPFASLPLLRPLMSPESGNLPRRTTVWLPEGAVEVPVCCRPHLEPGWRLPGPALIVEDFSTLLVLEGFQVQMTPRGHLILEG